MNYRLVVLVLLVGGSCQAMEIKEKDSGAINTAMEIAGLSDLPDFDLQTGESAQALLRLLDINFEPADQDLLVIVNSTFSLFKKEDYARIYARIKGRSLDKHKDNRITLLKELLATVNEVNKNQQALNKQLADDKKDLSQTVSDRNTQLIVAAITALGGIIGTVIASAIAATSC